MFCVCAASLNEELLGLKRAGVASARAQRRRGTAAKLASRRRAAKRDAIAASTEHNTRQ
jgi:hypothetical protein